MSLSQGLRERRAEIIREMRASLDSSDPIRQQRWKDLDIKQAALKLQIDAEENRAAMGRLEDEMSHVDRRAAQLPPINAGFSSGTDDNVTGTPEYREAFNKFCRKGTPIEMSLGAAEQRTYSGLSDAANGVLVPVGFQRELEARLLAFGQMRQACRVISTAAGNPLPWPTMDDTANAGTWLAEAAPVNQTNPTYSNVQLGASMLSSDMVLISVQLLQDSAFNMEQELAQAFGTRLGRGLNKAYTVGDGSVIPITGLLTALTAVGGRSVTAVGSSANDGGSETGGTTIGTDDFSNLIAGLDVAYRQDPSCAFMAHQSTFDTVRKLKDKYGRPVWEVSLAQGEPDKIYGYKYFYNNALPTIAVNAKTVIFGAFHKYIIRDVLGMTLVRYNELFMQNHQIGFEAFLRSDGKLLQPNAFVYLQQASS